MTELAAGGALWGCQGGIFTRTQWRASGGSTDQLQAQIDAGRWRALNNLVVCRHNGPLTPAQEEWAAVLSAWGPVALAGLTAMTKLGVRGWETSDVHILIRRGATVLPVPGVNVVIHESRRFQTADILPRHPPVTSLERSVIDAAVWSAPVWTAFRIAIAPVQQRLTTGERLLDCLQGVGRVRHRRPLMSLLADVSGGAGALSEVAFLRWCRRHGLPKPRLQVRVDSRGRRRYLDAVFDRPDGSALWVEIDGGVHLTLQTRWEDALKDNEAWMSGQAGLRLVSAAIYADDPRALRQLRTALGLRG